MRRATRFVLFVGLILATGHCNAILGNDDGQLAPTDASIADGPGLEGGRLPDSGEHPDRSEPNEGGAGGTRVDASMDGPSETGGSSGADSGDLEASSFDAPNDAWDSTFVCPCVHGVCGDAGACVCDSGFSGAACDVCAPQHFGLICQPCNCGTRGCDDGQSGTGECAACPIGFTGTNCDQCKAGYFGSQCQLCTCSNGICDDTTLGNGHCKSCKTGWSGTNCNACAQGFFGPTCQACLCLHGNCDQGLGGTGGCTCDPAWIGATCDTVDVGSIVPTLDGYLWVATCAGAAAGKDCAIHDDQDLCTNTASTTDFNQRGAFRHALHTVGGTLGTQYLINFEARGVTGGKNYAGGTRQSTATTSSETANDGWYVGGAPVDTKWNTYEIHVSPPVPGQPVNQPGVGGSSSCPTCPQGPDNVYFANAIPLADGVHETFPIQIQASFPVLGKGTITLVIHDTNCLLQQNCGLNPDPLALCTEPRTVDLTGMSPPPPSMFVQPLAQDVGGTKLYPQWLYIDVKSVTAP